MLNKKTPKFLEELRRKAEARLEEQSAQPGSKIDEKRLLHELQVYQIELELQNAELLAARNSTENLLQSYTELYDFSPIGYFSLGEEGRILELNLTGATLLGHERERLIKRRFQDFVAPVGRIAFKEFFEKIFSVPGKQICQMPMLNKTIWADIQAISANYTRDGEKWCRLAISDFTMLKKAKLIQADLDNLADSNTALKEEVRHRREAEKALKQSEAHYEKLFKEAARTQEQLRFLSHSLLSAQEAERRRISRQLHDEIIQVLVGINVNLGSLTLRKKKPDIADFRKNIRRIKRLVEKSVTIVHRFARELRPTVLDDFGLIPAIQSLIKDFSKRTSIQVHLFHTVSGEEITDAQRTVLFRVTQAALRNVYKHAGASQVEIIIKQASGKIRMEIKDNGQGFDVDSILFAKRHLRLGLLGSREQVEMVGGRFEVNSVVGQGTTILIDIVEKVQEASKRSDAEGVH